MVVTTTPAVRLCTSLPGSSLSSAMFKLEHSYTAHGGPLCRSSPLGLQTPLTVHCPILQSADGVPALYLLTSQLPLQVPKCTAALAAQEKSMPVPDGCKGHAACGNIVDSARVGQQSEYSMPVVRCAPFISRRETWGLLRGTSP